MKLIFATRRAPFPFILGGAERSLYELCLHFSQKGYEIVIVGKISFSEIKSNYRNIKQNETNIKINKNEEAVNDVFFQKENCLIIKYNTRFRSQSTMLADWSNYLQKTISKFKPDCLLCHLDGSLEVLLAGEQFNIPVIHFVRDTFNPINLLPYINNEKFTSHPNCIISNSYYVSNWLLDKTGYQSKVLYPIIKKQHCNVNNSKNVKTILYINPTKYKGENIVFELAKHFTKINFILAPSWGKTFDDIWSSLKNIEILNSCIDHKKLYGKADLVIVPTQEPEAFGRVGVEAQSFGIPVVASRHTGLKESLGNSAYLVENYESPASWIDTLDKILNSEKTRNQLIKMGYKNANQYNSDIIGLQMVKILNKTIKEFNKWV